MLPVLPAGEPWYIRSWGLDFNLVNRRWLRSSRRWYTLGWGLVDGEEVPDLLLLQSQVGDRAAADDHLDRVRKLSRRFIETVQDEKDHTSVRAAAVLSR